LLQEQNKIKQNKHSTKLAVVGGFSEVDTEKFSVELDGVVVREVVVNELEEIGGVEFEDEVVAFEEIINVGFVGIMNVEFKNIFVVKFERIVVEELEVVAD
jgi:hypothetical protein